MSELTREKIYKKELEKIGGEGNNNLERIRSLGGQGGSGLFTVNLTEGANQWLEQDKTNEEIFEALGEGPVYFIFHWNDMYLNGFVIGGRENGFYLITDTEHGTHVTFRNNHFYKGGSSPD